MIILGRIFDILMHNKNFREEKLEMEIAVCDDNSCQLEKLKNAILEIGEKCNIKLYVETYNDGKGLVEDVQEGKRFDIIFLDIIMNKMSGLQAAEEIRKQDMIVQLIYVTAHQNYMADSFRTAPVGFLKKPVQPEELKDTFLHTLKIVGLKDAYYHFRYNKIRYKILVGDILYCESYMRKTRIVTQRETYTVYRKLDLVEQDLADCKGCFLRIHESYLVNYRHIVQFSYDKIELANKAVLSVSRSRLKETARLLKELML